MFHWSLIPSGRREDFLPVPEGLSRWKRVHLSNTAGLCPPGPPSPGGTTYSKYSNLRATKEKLGTEPSSGFPLFPLGARLPTGGACFALFLGYGLWEGRLCSVEQHLAQATWMGLCWAFCLSHGELISSEGAVGVFCLVSQLVCNVVGMEGVINWICGIPQQTMRDRRSTLCFPFPLQKD